MKNAQVHRFRDRVAVSMPGMGETVYLEPKEAAKLEKALAGCAKSIRDVSFGESTFGTVAININDDYRFKQVRK